MNKNKALTIIVSLIIILGIIITLTSGFNVDMMTKKHSQVLLNIGKEYNIKEVKDITNEIFGKKDVELNKVEIFEEKLLVSADEITEEQKNSLVQKINEKYQTELKAEDINIESIPKANLKDYIMPHIMEFVWSILVILVYIIIRYRKLGILKVTIQTILGIILTQLLLFSLIAIIRLPLGSDVISLVYISYILSVFGLSKMHEEQLKIKEEEIENKKSKA